MASSNTNALRYGISALDIKYKAFAENDELLNEGTTGQMYYKRSSDGQIVTYDSEDYEKQELINAIDSIFLTNPSVNTTAEDYLVYNVINISEKTDLLNNVEPVSIGVNSKFDTNKTDSGLFIRVRGNAVTNSVVSFLESSYNKNHPDSNLSSVVLNITITEHGVGMDKTIEVPMNFNELTFVKLNPSDETLCTSFSISLDGVSFPLISAAYNEIDESEQNMLHSLNYGNNKFEAAAIDFIYYVDDVKNPVIYNSDDKVRMNSVISASELNKETFVVSSEKPAHKCLWAKIIE